MQQINSIQILPGLRSLKVVSQIQSVGIDKVRLNVVLSRDCVTRSTFKGFERIITSDKVKGPTSKSSEAVCWRRSETLEGAIFTYWLYKGLSYNPLNGVVSREWKLTLDFNPSKFMHRVEPLRAGRNNYIAGNVFALKIALEELERRLQKFNFVSSSGHQVSVHTMRVCGLDLARDVLFQHPDLKFREEYIQQCLRIMRRCRHPYVRYSDSTKSRIMGWEALEHDWMRYDPLVHFSETPDTVKSFWHRTKYETFSCYTKDQLDKSRVVPDVEKIRFEHRWYGCTTLEKKLKIKFVGDIVQEAQQVWDWHQGERVGTIPNFEKYIEEAVNAGMVRSAKHQKRKLLPIATSEMMQLFEVLWGTGDISYVPPFELQVGMRITKEVAEDMDLRLYNLSLAELDRAVEKVTGYVPRHANDKQAARAFAKLPKLERERRRAMKGQLIDQLNFIHDQCEALSGRQLTLTPQTWAQCREKLRRRLLCHP